METSPALRERQAAALPGLPVHWHDELAGLPVDRPLLLVANEFLDALPIRQFYRRGGRWYERLIGVDGNGQFGFVAATRSTPFPVAVGEVPELPDGTLVELGPAREALVEGLAARLVAQGGLARADRLRQRRAGHDRRHLPGGARATPRSIRFAPGEADLSAHVDFRRTGRAGAWPRVPTSTGR